MSRANELLLEAAFDITQVESLKQQFDTLLQQDSLVLNARRVERVDTAALQLCYAFIQQRTQQGLQTNWQQPSEALLQQATLLGLVQALHLTSD